MRCARAPRCAYLPHLAQLPWEKRQIAASLFDVDKPSLRDSDGKTSFIPDEYAKVSRLGSNNFSAEGSVFSCVASLGCGIRARARMRAFDREVAPWRLSERQDRPTTDGAVTCFLLAPVIVARVRTRA